MVLPLFAVLFLRWRTSGWSNLRQAFFISAMLFAASDLTAIWWEARHPINRSQAAWVVPMMVASIFAALVISARVVRWWASRARRGAYE
jgi:hypothetical protein